MDRLLAEHISGKIDHNYRLWILINIEIWYRMYFENETTQSMGEYIDRLMHKAASPRWNGAASEPKSRLHQPLEHIAD